MRVMRLTDSGHGIELEEANAPRPEPGAGELLIRICAAGVTPTELLWYPTSHYKNGTKRDNAVPGHEFSGVIAGAGEAAVGFSAGESVYGMNDWFAGGAMADFCISTPFSIAKKPSRLTHGQAASVPIGALTAWQGLFDRAKLKSGERVLVHGGAGAVGVFAVQLARYAGASVIATASSANLEFVASLGAEQVLDYRASRFEQVLSDIDVVFDTVGGDTLQRSWRVLKPSGRMITIAASEENATDKRIKKAFLLVQPNQKQLEEITKLLDGQIIVPVVDAVVPFRSAADAYKRNVRNRLGRGKLVVDLGADIQEKAAL
jgi:NADPH:quinone reductase-like Zn-dependent oxidoreductase